MHQKYAQSFILEVTELYNSGKRVSVLSTKYNIPKSTVYYWLNKYRVIKRTENKVFTANDIYLLRKRLIKIKIENQILKECECTAMSSRKEKLKAIAKLDGKYTIHALCRALGILRSTYYHYKFRSPEQTMIEKEDAIYILVIKDIFDSTKGRLGAKKIRAIMLNQGYRITSKRITRLMNEMGLVCISRKKRPQYNHSPTRVLRKNKLKREFTTDRPNRVWVSDITSFNLNYQPHYMCAVIDLYSRKVISYNISDNQEKELVIQTFKDAFDVRRPKDALMFHSDQGLQYTSYAFRKQLRDKGVVQSFSNPGCPHDNAVAESFFRSFKSEEVYQHYYKTYEQMEASIDEFIFFFNEERPHQSFNYLTPVQVEEKYYQNK